MGIIAWLKKILHIKPKEISEEKEHIVERLEREEFRRDHDELHLRPTKAVNQDVGRFMKHGHQSQLYRKSVKAKVKPEEDD